MSNPLLYHGTDARLARMSQEEIEAFKASIIKSLDFLWQFYEPYSEEHCHMEYNEVCKGYVQVRDLEKLKPILGYGTDPTLYNNLLFAISINQNRLKGRKGWQYDGLHLTNCEELAWHYAKRAFCFGEIGLVTYQFILASKKIRFRGWNPDPDVELAMKKICEFAEGKAEPIVVVIDDYDIKILREEGGKKLKEGVSSRVFTLKGKVDLRKFKILTEPSGDTNNDFLRFCKGNLIPNKW